MRLRTDEATDVARSLQVAVGVVVRRLRQMRGPDALTLPETSALSKLDRNGSCTAAALARLEQISPQSMGATIATLEIRDLVARRQDPTDGRQSIIEITPAGRAALRARRDAIASQMADVLRTFSEADRASLAVAAPLLERLAAELA